MGWKPRSPANGASAKSGAGNETRTRDLNLGKVALYQLSYSRSEPVILPVDQGLSTPDTACSFSDGHAARRYS